MRQAKGTSYMVRYADDAVFGFKYENEAKEFDQQLIVRLNQFNLEITDEKTKFINLGKNKDNNDSDTGSLDFLGTSPCFHILIYFNACRTLKVGLSGRYPIIRIIEISVLLAVLPMPMLFT